MQPLFVVLGEPPYCGRDHLHVEIPMEVYIPDVPGRIHNVP
jgi:hypothetical protein